MTGGGGIGTIKAFRDPLWFCDPADNQAYLLFSASLAKASSPWNGAVGLARRVGESWALADPPICAVGLNKERERPHVICRDGRYYCFWSTQSKVFADGGSRGPTGLYGMVSYSMSAQWRPLSGSGMVLANPSHCAIQAYSWLVLSDLSVISFNDRPGLVGEPRNALIARRHFGDTPAAPLHLKLDGDQAGLV